MELSLVAAPLKSIGFPVSKRRLFHRKFQMPRCSSDVPSLPDALHLDSSRGGRRRLIGSLFAAAAGLHICDIAGAVSTSRRALKGAKIPESEYTTLPNGLKYYDLKVGSGTEAVKGSRVAVWL